MRETPDSAPARAQNLPDSRGYFGQFGGRFVPETLMPPLIELEEAFRRARRDRAFRAELDDLLEHFVGRPTPLYHARRMSAELGAKIWLKREDLLHTGAHKINNALGQVLLAERMGKKRIVAETGAGQHGVATATAAANRGLACTVYMGAEDARRQALNVSRMQLLGAEVVQVQTGQKTLKEAINEAIRDWIAHVDDTHYLLGSVLGPHPYPWIVRDFQSVIGREARKQIRAAEGRDPDRVIACVGGGSNAIGIFHEFLAVPSVRLQGVEAGGRGDGRGEHAARMLEKEIGVLHGTRTFVLQDPEGQIGLTHSVAAGLDYAALGPEHAHHLETGRLDYHRIGDRDALQGFKKLCRLEGIIPALESSHAIAFLFSKAGRPKPGEVILVNLSGRGDKDVPTLLQEGLLPT